MARLTWTKEDGSWGVTGMDFNLAKLSPVLYGALAKLKDYEEICDSPDKLREIDELYREKCEEVNKLKNTFLPIKVGDTVYLRACCECVSISTDPESGAQECPFENICEFEECCNGNERLFKTTVASIWNEGNDWRFAVKGLDIDFPVEDIGKHIFFTEEEAEQEGGI